MTRSEELNLAVREQIRVHKEWQDDTVNRGDSPDTAYWDGVTALFATFAAGDIPTDCRELEDMVGRFHAEVEIFDGRDNVNNPEPHVGLWAAWEGVARLFDLQQRPPIRALESIATLKEQKLSDIQIAVAYNFYDHRGYPVAALVEKEFAVPGSVTRTRGAVDGRDWEHPQGIPVVFDDEPDPEGCVSLPVPKGRKAKAAGEKLAA